MMLFPRPPTVEFSKSLPLVPGKLKALHVLALVGLVFN